MTPEEKAVIEAAVELASEAQGRHTMQPRWGSMNAFVGTVNALIYSCPQCNAGGHMCPGDGNPIGHTQTDCGEHEECDNCAPLDAGASATRVDGTDERTVCDTCGAGRPAPAPEWTPAMLSLCLAGDHIRIGTDETDVIRTDGGREWHVDNTDSYRPKPWKHIELRMELAANPGFQEYPPNTPCEILAGPERKASLLVQLGFTGSAVISSDVD